MHSDSDVLQEACAYQIDFQERMETLGLPMYDRWKLCCKLLERSKIVPSEELLRVYVEVLCDNGLLLDREEPDDERQIIHRYIRFLPERDALLQMLIRRNQMAKQFASVADLSIQPAEERLEDAVTSFTCFEHGSEDNLLLQNSGLTFEELDAFECSEDPRIAFMLREIFTYLDGHRTEVTERFVGKPFPAVKRVCTDVLTAVSLPKQSQPKDIHEQTLLLAAINGRLMELEDDLASRYLFQTGEYLTDGRMEAI